MLYRCKNPAFRQWADYGGRGIKVCERWLDFNNFVADMGDKPPRYSLDRIDNSGSYEPMNCKWSSRSEQQRNQRVTRKVVIDGVEYLAAVLSEMYGLKTDTILKRASDGLSFDDVISAKKRVFTPGLALGGQASGAKKRSMTHCRNGHEFTTRNTFFTKEGWRRCRKCHSINEAKRRVSL